MEDKAAFLFDTNFIIQVKKLDEVVKNLEDQFSVYITQVSIDERIAQVCRDLKAKFDKIDELKEEYSSIASISLKTTFEEKAKKYQAGMQAKYEKLFGGNVIPFSKSEQTFSDLLNRANQKKAPFSAESGASDKGFKDSLLWMSILTFFKENGENKVIFVTNDNVFKKYSVILTQEFSDATGKMIEIKDSNYYQKLLEVEPDITEPKIIKTIVNLDDLREKIRAIIDDLRTTEVEDYYGNSWNEPTFTLSEKVDSSYVEIFLENLRKVIMENIFEENVPASKVFTLDDRVADGDFGISISAMEKVIKLFDEIQTQYPDYIQQFYSAVANILNLNYKESNVQKNEYINEYTGELPF